MKLLRKNSSVLSSSSTMAIRIYRQLPVLLIFILIFFLAFVPPPFITSHLPNSLQQIPDIRNIPKPVFINSYVTQFLRSTNSLATAHVNANHVVPRHELNDETTNYENQGQSDSHANNQISNPDEYKKPISAQGVPPPGFRKTTPSSETENSLTVDQKKLTYDVEHTHEDSLGKWALPSALSTQLESAVRGSSMAKEQERHPWTQPLVISSYTRARDSSGNDFDVFVYVTGVTMGNFKRSLSAAGCLIGKDVYPVQSGELEVFYCRVPRAIHPGERISLVLRHDAALNAALSRPVAVRAGMTLALERGSITPLDKAATLRLGIGESNNVDDFMVVRSDAKVGSNLDAPADAVSKLPRYEICAATMMKQFPHLLRDWVDYHRRIGVDMVYILDNAATKNVAAMFAGRNDVETIYWPWRRSQVQALSAVLMAARSRCEWLLLNDADEYLMVGVGANGELAGKQPLRGMLQRMRGAGYEDVRFGYITMGPSGNVYIPKKPAPEAYVDLWWRQKRNGKTVSLTAREWRVSKVHYNKAARGIRVRRLQEEVKMRPVEEKDMGAMVHFQMRSMEESLLKASFESASIGDMNLGPRKKANFARLKRPPSMYRQTDSSQRYEHFRNIWRQVTAAGTMGTQSLVRDVDGRREVRVWDLQRKNWAR